MGLDLGQAIPLVEKLSCAGASEHVGMDVFRYPCLLGQGLKPVVDIGWLNGCAKCFACRTEQR